MNDSATNIHKFMKKIMIIGCGGSGKTTLAKQLSQELNLPLFHLDNYFWQPGWQEAPYDEFIEKQYELIMKDSWIIDGNYTRSLSIRLREADTIIFLDISRWRCLYQAIKRQMKWYKQDRSDVQVACPAHFDRKFLSFLRYIWNYNKKTRPHILTYCSLVKSDIKVYHITSYKQLDQILSSVNIA